METFIHQLVPIIAILSAVAFPIGVVLYLGNLSLKNKHRENMESLRQGMPMPARKAEKRPDPNRLVGLRNGFLCIGLAVGTIAGITYTKMMQTNNSNGETFFTIVASLLLFLGIAYILYYFVSKNKIDAGSSDA